MFSISWMVLQKLQMMIEMTAFELWPITHPIIQFRSVTFYGGDVSF